MILTSYLFLENLYWNDDPQRLFFSWALLVDSSIEIIVA